MRRHLVILFFIIVAAVLVEWFLLKGGRPRDVKGLVQRFKALGRQVHVIVGVVALLILMLMALRLLVMFR
jgi:hypothetical protein